MTIKKYLRSNLGFIITLIAIMLMAFSPTVKGIVMQGLIKTGLFNPDVNDSDKTGESQQADQSIAMPVAPSATFTGEDGSAIDLTDLRGKVIFLNFWATWCPPCMAEMPSVNALHEKFKNNPSIVFMLVDADGSLKKASAFMKKRNFSLPVYIPAAKIPEELFQGSLPTTIIINKKGEIVFGHEGMADYNSPKVHQFLNKLITE
ncbi:TlpA family protein disulfide reductase [Pedobacter sp. BS3]|uniref:TlpA family protein disulfide reductase n=1 Tax=Pedobacter sp. BS3 TaxID=2567937 RepID=UPI0011F0531E|nr:TlpA disulfide reductase family protein [Pedobacter sp. BS3]TZF82538.1 TlpA family protein disulfide reductase [Pedobacter sp. BS3]